jgi:hypothetical protein
MSDIITRIETINPKSTDTVVLFFNTKEHNVNRVQTMFDAVREKFPNNRILALPDTMSLKDFDKELLLKLINGIIKEVCEQ